MDFNDMEARNSVQRQRQQEKQRHRERMNERLVNKVKNELLGIVYDMIPLNIFISNNTIILIFHCKFFKI